MKKLIAAVLFAASAAACGGPEDVPECLSGWELRPEGCRYFCYVPELDCSWYTTDATCRDMPPACSGHT